MIKIGFILSILFIAFHANCRDLNAIHRLKVVDPISEEELPTADSLEIYADFLATHKGISISNALNVFPRYAIFKKNLEEIRAHNRNKKHTYKRGINQFTDLTHEEFIAQMTMKKGQNCSATEGTFTLTAEEAQAPLPHYFDWRQSGIITPVKAQGKCGSCWTFSTTGALEAHFALATGTAPRNLSEQQLLDCAGDYDNHGCSGGLPSHAFEYIKNIGGLDIEEAYPYEAVQGECRYDKWGIGAVIKGGSVNITALNEDQLTKAIMNKGPVSIAFQVIEGFRDYLSGVYRNETCKNGPQDVNHAVLAVGFGIEAASKIPYYLVKNSWGESWGDHGYFKIERGVNMCGVAQCASYPNIKLK